MKRRRLLRVAGAAGLAGLSGCLFGPPDRSSLPPPQTSTDSSGTPTDEPQTATATATPTTTATETTGGDGTTDAGTATATPTTTPTPTETTTAPQESVQVTVGEGGTFYDPEEFTLAVGGTVEWVWRGSGHNIVVDERPDDSAWEGTPGGDTRLYDAGYSYSETFEVAGQYRYHCYNHEVYGMVGRFSVE